MKANRINVAWDRTGPAHVLGDDVNVTLCNRPITEEWTDGTQDFYRLVTSLGTCGFCISTLALRKRAEERVEEAR